MNPQATAENDADHDAVDIPADIPADISTGTLQPPTDPADDVSCDNPVGIPSRTPHPYHHPQFEILNPASRVVYRARAPPSPLSIASLGPADASLEQRRGSNISSNLNTPSTPSRLSAASTPRRGSIAHGSSPWWPKQSRGSATTSDSGTEADDEHFLKGLPAPRPRLHKGVRGLSEPASGAATPLFPPLALENKDVRKLSSTGLGVGLGIGITTKEGEEERGECDARLAAQRHQFLVRRAKVVVRRGTEAALLGILALAVASNPTVGPLLDVWGWDMAYLVALVVGLTALYPLRLAMWAYERGKLTRWLPINIFRSSFDPAPLIYPPAITMLASLLTGASQPTAILPNLVMSMASIPHRLIPYFYLQPVLDPVHWALTLLPLLWARNHQTLTNRAMLGAHPALDDETLALLFPIHQATASVLRQITLTSLLPAELQLVTTGLINLLLLSRSPQMITLAGILWIGGVCTLVLSESVIRSGIALARIPSWRFRRAFFSPKAVGIPKSITTNNTTTTSSPPPPPPPPPTTSLLHTALSAISLFHRTTHDDLPDDDEIDSSDGGIIRKTPRSHRSRSRTHTPSGRRKRTTSVSVRPFLKLTPDQAERRKWAYAAWVYGCGVVTYLIGRLFLVRYALEGYDPICWALGYLFGDLQRFRLEVLKLGWDRYIPLPPRTHDATTPTLLGWVDGLRHTIGPANARLMITAYFFSVMVVGFSIVFQLKHVYEVDTRRKGFHFLMVVWWLPTIFIDPAFVAVLYVANLALFLVIDMLRASQLPPLSKPIANFIAPYIDGRDLAGPVVISPIFLAIGCAIPLWLSLASLPRIPTSLKDGDEYVFGIELAGWEVPAREVAMVAGVVCVGLGDAAASLIGRRWGHHKWLWGGSKSIEGSLAFIGAVFVGLVVAKAWVVAGGWKEVDGARGWGASMCGAGVCAAVASVTEAALTGGNDNVIVPVVLWTCVKGLGV